MSLRAKPQAPATQLALGLQRSRPKPPAPAAEPTLGLQRSRVLASFAMYALAAAVLYQNMTSGGMMELVGSHARARAPWVAACGQLEAKEYLLAADRVVRHGVVAPGVVHVRGGLIAGVYSGRDRLAVAAQLLKRTRALPLLDYGDAVIAPGLIDVHVHMNEPGREEWEGMRTATRAAAAGGVTTVVDMPLNCHPCTTTPGELARKVAAAAAPNKTWVDVGFWAGLVPGNAHQPAVLKALARGGALGFKAFMSPSGIDDFPNVSPDDVAGALPTLRALGLPLLVHAELVDDDLPAQGDPRQHATWLASRPRRFEKNAVQALLAALRATAGNATLPGFRVHIVHLADADLLPELAAAKAEGLPLSVEVCPHHLTFAAEEVPAGDTRFKCAPPLREGENCGRLLAGLRDGTIDSLATDHSPSEPALKLLQAGDFMRAWGGISGLQYALPASWQAGQAAGLNLTRFVQAWSELPAALAGLQERKGRLVLGMDADIVVWAPERAADTSTAALQHRHKVTPYADMRLAGRVLATYVRGARVFSEGEGVAGAACGRRVLGRPAAKAPRARSR